MKARRETLGTPDRKTSSLNSADGKVCLLWARGCSGLGAQAVKVPTEARHLMAGQFRRGETDDTEVKMVLRESAKSPEKMKQVLWWERLFEWSEEVTVELEPAP